MDNDAVRLFVDRAQLVKRGFSLSAETGPVVAEICQRLDGIPLAIELAAARLQALGPQDILDRLDERFRLLAGGKRTVLERHQTLRGAIDWSYDLLDPAEQLLFARLSIFAGGFTLEAAEAVAGDEGVDVLTLLAGLISKSMVVTDDTQAGVRYRLLETLRDYAAERLGELDDPDAVGARHAAYYHDVVDRAAPMLKGADEVVVAGRLAAEQDNLRAALGWSRDHDDPVAFSTMVRDLGLYWFNTGEYGDLDTWTGEAIKAAPAAGAEVRADLLMYLGVCANARRPGEARALLEASLECSRAAGRPPSSRALSFLGIAELESNRPLEAIARYEEGVDAARASGDDYDVLLARSFLALGCILSGESARGLAITEEVLVGARRIGNTSLLTHALQSAGIARVRSEPERAVELLEECEERSKGLRSGIIDQTRYFRGVAHLAMGRSADAARELRSALTIMRERGSDYFASMVVGTTAALLARDEPSLATRLLGALDRFRTEHEITGAAGDLESQHRTRARLERRLDATEFADAWALGTEMTLDEVVALTDAELEKLTT
jgi:tetratricopeptide (TPR) repeat protein